MIIPYAVFYHDKETGKDIQAKLIDFENQQLVLPSGRTINIKEAGKLVRYDFGLIDREKNRVLTGDIVLVHDIEIPKGTKVFEVIFDDRKKSIAFVNHVFKQYIPYHFVPSFTKIGDVFKANDFIEKQVHGII